MRGGCWLLALTFCLGGCESASQERLSDYSQDGLYLFQRGNYAAARESFQAALALKPNDPALLYDIGECSDRLGDTANAERYYSQCLLHAPNQVECRHALASLLVRVGRKDDAAHLIQDWLAPSHGWRQLTPKTAGYGTRPVICRVLRRDCSRRWSWTHTTPAALVELALVYEAMQRPDRAAALYERVLDQDPHQTEVARRLDRLHAQGAGQPHPD